MSLGEVDADILPVIDELQGGADGIRTSQIVRRGGVEQVQQQAADRVGGTAAVVHQFVETGIAILHHILGESVEQVTKKIQRQPVFCNVRSQTLKERMIGRLAALDKVEFLLVSRQQALALGGR